MVQGVEFDEEKKIYGRPQVPPGGASYYNHQQQNMETYSPIENEPKMVQWLIRHGYAKSPNVGRIVLLIAIGINIVITYFVITNFL